MLLRNDATAAISISSMEGLLRRVRHIELRARYIPGLENPSDGLTKSFKTRDIPINLEREVGLVYGLDTNSFLWVKSFLIEFFVLWTQPVCAGSLLVENYSKTETVSLLFTHVMQEAWT